MKKKLFCVLEHGSVPNEELTLKHKRDFSKPHCDFYRVNWYTKKDPSAQWSLIFSNWTETRNFLYEQVRGQYEYYVFIDDDAKFIPQDSTEPAEIIRHNLLRYKPLLAGFYSPLRWMNPIDRSENVRCGSVIDLECIILHESLAEVCLPSICWGAGGSWDYIYYVVHKLFPQKYHIYLNMEVHNTRSRRRDPTKPNDYTEPDFDPKFLQLATKEHKKDMADHSALRNRTFCDEEYKNKHKLCGMLFNDTCQPDFSEYRVTLDDLGEVLDINHPDYVHRLPVLPMNHPRKQQYIAYIFWRNKLKLKKHSSPIWLALTLFYYMCRPFIYILNLQTRYKAWVITNIFRRIV